MDDLPRELIDPLKLRNLWDGVDSYGKDHKIKFKLFLFPFNILRSDLKEAWTNLFDLLDASIEADERKEIKLSGHLVDMSFIVKSVDFFWSSGRVFHTSEILTRSWKVQHNVIIDGIEMSTIKLFE